jgi:hypothetical protein
MTKQSLQIVRESLQAYADRGLFRGFNESRSGQFEFVWLLQHAMTLRVNTARRQLQFAQLLPGVPAKSSLYAELKQFIEARHDESLPDHRQINRQHAELNVSNRGGAVTLTLNVKNDQYAYAVNKLVNLVHELFVYLRDAQPEYLMENFNVPQE